MARHSIQKLFGLILLYAFIIVGIFALQFRNQSIFTKNYYQLRLTLSQNKHENQDLIQYEDTFFVVYKGMTIYSDKNNKPYLLSNSGEKTFLTFESYTENSNKEFTLYFSDKVSVLCHLSGKNNDNLYITANIPSSSSLYMPYKISKSYTITDSSAKMMILKSNNKFASIQAPEIQEKQMLFSSAKNTISYESFEPVAKFAFESIANHPLASSELLNENINTISLICETEFDPAQDFNEQAANAYMAEMTAKSRYIDAMEKIPESYKKDSRRTFITAPYFNNLVQMNSSMEMQIGNLEYKANYSIEKQNLSIFETDNLADFLMTQNASFVSKVCSIPSAITEFLPTVLQASGIIQVYTNLTLQNNKNANLLAAFIPKCIETVEKSIVLENDKLFITQNKEKPGAITQVSIGNIMYRYGKISGNENLKSAGIMLVNSNIPQKKHLTLNTAAELYSILKKDNAFLPHFKLIKYSDSKPVWAWTSAQSVKYDKDEYGTILISTKFPAGAVHYMILKNIEPFSKIEIYGIKFRTDPRFESYNSSGYVYLAETKTLLLKYRHKSEIEDIRLFYEYEQNSTEPDGKITSAGSTASSEKTLHSNENAKPQSATVKNNSTNNVAGTGKEKTPSANTVQPENLIEGKWVNSKPSEMKYKYLEFLPEETGKNAAYQGAAAAKNFTFSISDNKITFSGKEINGTYEFELKDDKLTINFNNSKKDVYIKR
ncbi:MAG: hypothetical protein ACTTHG_02185 [Treponemataceae bacterium]